MPRFFYHLRAPPQDDGRDHEGTDLSDLDAARHEGIASAKELVASALMSGVPLARALARVFDVADETGRTVLTLDFADAAQAEGHPPTRRHT